MAIAILIEFIKFENDSWNYKMYDSFNSSLFVYIYCNKYLQLFKYLSVSITFIFDYSSLKFTIFSSNSLHFFEYNEINEDYS